MSTYLTEEEQIENFKNFFKKYKYFIVIFISILLLSFALFQYINRHRDKQNHLLSSAYENMMVAVSNHNGEQIQAYANTIIEVNRKSVYRDAAFLTLAKLKVEEEDLKLAKEYLQKVNYLSSLVDLAKIRTARILNSENEYEPAFELLERVNAREYQPLVNETKGDIYAKMKRFDEALKYYNLAAEDEYLQSTGNTFLEIKINEIQSHVQKTST